MTHKHSKYGKYVIRAHFFALHAPKFSVSSLYDALIPQHMIRFRESGPWPQTQASIFLQIPCPS